MTATKRRMTRVPTTENLQGPDAEAIEAGMQRLFAASSPASSNASMTMQSP